MDKLDTIIILLKEIRDNTRPPTAIFTASKCNCTEYGNSNVNASWYCPIHGQINPTHITYMVVPP